MNENPYTPPAADIRDDLYANAVKLYSPAQAACGAFLGGPVALIYFLRKNFSALGNDSAASKTVGYGVLFILGLLALIPILPDRFPSIVFTIAYIFIAKSISENYQKKKQEIAESPEYDFHSNWRVLGFGLLCAVGSGIAIIVPLLILVELGIWNP